MHRGVSMLRALHGSTLLESEVSKNLVDHLSFFSLARMRLKHVLNHGTFERIYGLPEVDDNDNVEGIRDDAQPRDNIGPYS
jgi:hypothetical protein